MATAARLAMSAWRYETCARTIVVTGLDLTGVPLGMQVRMRPDTPGDPLIDLATVTTEGAEGLYLAAVDRSGPAPVSRISLVIAKATMESADKVPYVGELGADSVLAYNLQIDGETRLYGAFIALANAYGSDNAPSQRDTSGGVSRAPAVWGSVALNIADEEAISISIDGAAVLSAIAAQAEAARDAVRPLHGIGAPAAEAGIEGSWYIDYTVPGAPVDYYKQADGWTGPYSRRGDPGGNAESVGLFAEAKSLDLNATGGVLQVRFVDRGKIVWDRYDGDPAALDPAAEDATWVVDDAGNYWTLSRPTALGVGMDPAGAADGTAAFQAGVALADRLGVAFHVEPGRYLISSPETLTLPAKLLIVGEDRELSVLVGPGAWPVSDPDLDTGEFRLVEDADWRFVRVGFERFNHTFRARENGEGPASIAALAFEQCGWRHCYSALVTARNQRSPRTDLTIKSLVIEGCDVREMQYGFYAAAVLQYSRVKDNVVRDINRTHTVIDVDHTDEQIGNAHGFYLGSGSPVTDAQWRAQKKFIVTGNDLDGLSTVNDNPRSGSSDVNGIIVQGYRAQIDGNQVSNLSSPLGTNTEGIYTKMRFGSISGNIMWNAGTFQGAIVFKGFPLSQPAPAVYGTDAIVAHNIIGWDGAPTGNRFGMLIEGDRVQVTGNRIIGAAVCGIAADNQVKTQLDILDNVVEMWAAGSGIYCERPVTETLRIDRNDVKFVNVTSGDCVGINWKFGSPTALKTAKGYITRNVVTIDASCVGLSLSSCVRFSRTGPVGVLAIEGNDLDNRATITGETTDKFRARWIQVIDVDRTIDELRIEHNALRGFEGGSTALSLVVTEMGGTLIVRDNPGFVTVAEGVLDIVSLSSQTVNPPLSSIAGITGVADKSIPLANFDLTFVGEAAGVNKCWIGTTGENSFTIALDADAPAGGCKVKWRARREEWVIDPPVGALLAEDGDGLLAEDGDTLVIE